MSLFWRLSSYLVGGFVSDVNLFRCNYSNVSCISCRLLWDMKSFLMRFGTHNKYYCYRVFVVGDSFWG